MIDKATGEYVACKRISLNSSEEGIPATTIREIANLKALSHPNIVRVLDVTKSGNELIIVLEYLDYNLQQIMEKTEGSLPPALIKVRGYYIIELYAAIVERNSFLS